MIQAVYRNRVIHPWDEVPTEWRNGQRLRVELAEPDPKAVSRGLSAAEVVELMKVEGPPPSDDAGWRFTSLGFA